MSRLRLLVCLLLFYSSFTFGQNDGVYTYGTSGAESASAIIELSNGTYIIGGKSSGNDFTLLNVDNNGTIIKQATLSNTLTITKLLLLSNNDILVVGTQSSPEYAALVVIRLNSNLTIQWAKQLSGTFMAYAFSAIECQNGELMFVGYSSTSGTSSTDWDGLAFRLFANGNLRWKKVIQTSTLSDWLVDLVELPGGNIVAVGASSQSTVDFQIMKITPSGNTSNLKTFEAGQNEVMYHALFINNKLYISAGSWSFSFGQYDMSYLKLDTNFNIEISKVYGGNGMDFPLYSVYANNEISVFGYTNTFDSDYDLIITSFDLLGNKLRTKRIGGANRELVSTKGNSFLVNSSNKFVTVGETSTFGNGSTDIFLSFSNPTINCCPFVTDVTYSIANASYTASSSASITSNTTLNTFSNLSSTPSTSVLYTSTSNCANTSINSTIQADTVVCLNNVLNFNITTNAINPTYSWNFGDPSAGTNNSSTLQNPNFTYTTAGNYQVIVTTSNGCSLTKDTLNVNVKNSNNINLAVSTTKNKYCLNENVSFSSNLNLPNTIYNWNFGDPASGANNIATTNNTSHTFSNPGNYIITLIAQNACNSDTDTVHINIISSAPINTTISTTSLNYCVNQQINFNSSLISANVIYQWNFGDPTSGINNSSSINNPSHVFTNSGTYIITLIINNECASDTDTISININDVIPSNLSAITSQQIYCTNQNVDFSSNFNSSNSNYAWDFGDPSSGINNTASTINASHSYTTAGDYIATLIVNNNCASDTDTIHIHITPEVFITSQISISNLNYCTGDSIRLFGNSNDILAQYSWDVYNAANLKVKSFSTKNSSFTLTSNGTYKIYLITNNMCHSDTDSVTINITGGVSALAESIKNTYCVNEMVSFTGTISGVSNSFIWNFDDPTSGSNNSSVLLNPTHTFTTQGKYTVTLIAIGNCLPDTSFLEINISEGIDLATQINNIPRNYCPNSPIAFNANSADPNVIYNWDFGDPTSGSNNSSTESNPTHTFSTQGNYIVTLTSNNDCKQEVDTIHLVIAPLNTPGFDYILDSCSGTVLFTNNTIHTNDNTYSWLLNNDIISQEINASTIISIEGTYNVGLIVNPNTNCADTLFQVFDFDLLDDSSNLFIPNIFTPNADGINDTFKIIGGSVCKIKKFIVFNRWGRKLYETETSLEWDGKIGNEYCPVGTYIVYLELENKKIVRTVSLLK